MQENRSFDHYFGAMPGVRGFSDPSAIPGVFKQADPDNPDGYLYPFHADTHSTSAQSAALDQPQLAAAARLVGQRGHERLRDRAAQRRRSTRYDGTAAQYSMAYFKRDDIPFQWALADAFTICDGYHCSVLGPTWPNRLYLMTGQIDPAGTNGGPIYGNYGARRGLLVADLSGAADRGRRVLEGVPGDRQLRLQRAGVLRQVPERVDLVTAVPERDEVLPARPVRVRRASTTGCRRCRTSSRPPTSPSTPTSCRRRARTTSRARSTRSRPIPTSGPRRSSSSSTTRTTGTSITCSRPPRPAGTPGEYITSSAYGREGRARADRPGLPRPLHPRLAVDGGRLRLPRHVRPHLGYPAARAGDRRGQPQHHRLAAPDRRRLHLRARDHSRAGGSRGCRTPSSNSSWPRQEVVQFQLPPLPGREPDAARPAARVQAGARRDSRLGRSPGV